MGGSGLIAEKPKPSDSSYHITIISWPGKEILVVTTGIPLKSVLPVTAPFPCYHKYPCICRQLGWHGNRALP